MESVKTIIPKVRKPLQVLQPTATDNETLVGVDKILKPAQQPKEKLKRDVTKMAKKNASKSKKETKEDKVVQTSREEKVIIEIEDLTSTANPSENYWKILAERRRMALLDTLEKNKELVRRIEKLDEENRLYKEMLDETRTLVEVLQEQIEDNTNEINDSLDDSNL